MYRLLADMLLAPFFIGAGVGFRYTDALYYQSYTHTSVQYVSDTYESRSQEYLIPVYARIKYNFSDKFVAPFIQGNVGYSFNVGGNTKAVKGLYLEPAIGIDFNLKTNKPYILLLDMLCNIANMWIL